jgi:hypothetical protein
MVVELFTEAVDDIAYTCCTSTRTSQGTGLLCLLKMALAARDMTMQGSKGKHRLLSITQQRTCNIVNASYKLVHKDICTSELRCGCN